MTPTKDYRVVIRRFWKKVHKAEACWLWMGTANNKGYGRFHDPLSAKKQKHIYAHRFAWEISRGEIPADKIIMHICDTPLCVNPDHLRLGTFAENAQDCVRKGRHQSHTNPGCYSRGETHSARMKARNLKPPTRGPKITREQAEEIRRSNASPSHLREKYGIDLSTVYKIKKGTLWR